MASTKEQKFGDLTVRIERDTCIASENCINLAPEVFVLDDEQIVDFTGESEIDRQRLIEACALCPVDALVVTDGAGNQLVP